MFFFSKKKEEQKIKSFFFLYQDKRKDKKVIYLLAILKPIRSARPYRFLFPVAVDKIKFVAGQRPETEAIPSIPQPAAAQPYIFLQSPLLLI